MTDPALPVVPASSGVIPVFTDPPLPPSGIPAVSPVTSTTQQTVVVAPPPAPETPSQNSQVNPFIPVIPPTPPETSQPSPPMNNTPIPSRRSGFPKIIIMILVVIVLLAVLGFAGMAVLRLINGNKEVSITYWGQWESEEIMANIITDFETKFPKIKVQYIKQSPRQYRQRLQAAIDRGEGPDVFRFHNTWVPMLRSILSPVPKTIMTTTDFSSTFYPIATNDLVAGQTIYGLPLMFDGLGLYYNVDLFTAAGITNPPTTWGELMEMVPKLTQRSGDMITSSAVALGTTGNVENFSDIMGLMLAQNGAKLDTPTGTEAEQTLIFYHKFADPSDALYTWNEALDNSIYAFATGRVAMILAPSWRAFDIKQMNPNTRFAIAPVPQLPGTTITWASYWVEGVSGKSNNQKEAWEFVNFLTSQEIATKLYTQASSNRLFGEPYARVAMGSSVASDPYVGAFIKQAPNAISFPLASRTFDEGLNDKLIKYLEDAINGLSSGSSPTAVLETASAGFHQVLSSFGLSSNAASRTQ